MMVRRFFSEEIRYIMFVWKFRSAERGTFLHRKVPKSKEGTRRPYNLSTLLGDSDTYIFSGLRYSLLLKFTAIFPQYNLDPKIFRPSVL